MRKEKYLGAIETAVQVCSLILVALLGAYSISVKADGSIGEIQEPMQSINLTVGDFFTLYVPNFSHVTVDDESVVEAVGSDATDIVIVARIPGSTKIRAWQAGASTPKLFEVHVDPRPSPSVKLEPDYPTKAEPFEEYAPYSGWAAGESDSSYDGRPTHKRELTIYVGSVVTRDLGDVSRVVVGNEATLKASTLDDGKLLLLGLEAGVSELDVWTENDDHTKYLVRVYQAPPSDPMQVINAVLGSYPGVTAENHLGTIILRGIVDAARYNRFNDLVGGFKGVISLVEPEVNIAIENSIVLDVSVLEINKSYQRTLGVRWQNTGPGPAFGVVGNLIPNNRFGVFSDVGNREDLTELLGAVGSSTQKLSGYFGITSIIGSELQLLQEEGKAKVLAAPSLSTVSGESATFLAGGELPVAVLNQFGQPVVEFRQFGIQLAIEPIADRHMNIRSKIRAEVSDVDFSVEVNGVPGLRRRETTSTITARPGDTIVISGLLNASDSTSAYKVPGLGDIPILGRLFRSDDFVKQRTELVVTVTPRIRVPDEPIGENFQRVDQELRSVLSGGERLNTQLME